MERTKLDILAEEVLSNLERRENRLLIWGLVGGRFDVYRYVHEALNQPVTMLQKETWEELQAAGIDENDVIENLQNRRLLFTYHDAELLWGRTRYAETIRLLYLLKQRFSLEDWLSGLNLVSNIKPVIQARRFPFRDQIWPSFLDTDLDMLHPGRIGYQVLEVLLERGKIQLAAFQVRALHHLLKHASYGRDTGTLIGAGTGSGKTKAYYLPVFVWLSENLTHDDKFWTRAVSIYPRVELLKDQLRECIAQTRLLNPVLTKNSLRPVNIAAFFGLTPSRASSISQQDNNYYRWEKTPDGYICPFLLCPECKSALVWPETEYLQEVEGNQKGLIGLHELLKCTNKDCSVVITGQELRLTRGHIEQRPPDIVFTTNEMLNRVLAGDTNQHVLGLNPGKTPRFVLLDEAHIYEGITGAHSAYVLRRWRYLVSLYNLRSAVTFVGLTATLNNPRQFISALTGVPNRYCQYIYPTDRELNFQGMEYNLVLRGDPVSSAALLSTSVQTCMLLGRMLDWDESVSAGSWGTKIFGFADKLDVINRWYYIERDAETKKVLSQYRDIKQVRLNDPDTIIRRNKLGQLWHLSDKVNPGCLEQPLEVDITSSQSRGINPRARLVLASSTLEVGMDDTQVGAVIQHKAPHSAASFLQRKGRAGRTQSMRPWMVVVTSAYGRDRWAYENAEQLFNPSLPDLVLPLRNSYVLHIQAAFAVMDWLAWRLAQKGMRRNIWYIIPPKRWVKQNRGIKQMLINIIEEVIKGDSKGLISFIQSSLDLSEAELEIVLWSPPRSILMDLLPTLLQGMKNDWCKQVKEGRLVTLSFKHGDQPLQGYIPRSLFSDLELQELTLDIPGRDDSEYLPLIQGLNELTPGNATRRYTELRWQGKAHWLALPEEDGKLLLHPELVHCDSVCMVKENVEVYTPYKYQLDELPPRISDRSTGVLKWESILKPSGYSFSSQKHRYITGVKETGLPFFRHIEAFCISENRGLSITRFATEVEQEIKRQRGNSSRHRFLLTRGGKPAALGIRNLVDGMSFRCESVDLRFLCNNPKWSEFLKHLRIEYYFYRLQADPELDPKLSVFEINWLGKLFLASCIALSISMQISLQDALVEYRKNHIAISRRSLRAIFKLLVNLQAQGDQEYDLEEEGRLNQRLIEHLSDADIFDTLSQHYQIVYADLDLDDAFWQWLQERYIATMGAAIKDAIAQLEPSLDMDEILIDLQEDCIYLSEQQPGGMGLITAIVNLISTHPAEFAEAFWYCLDYCPRRELTDGMNNVVNSLAHDKLHETLLDLSITVNLEEQEQKLEQLQRELDQLRIKPSPQILTAIISKLLPNYSRDFAELVMLIHQKKHQEEERLQLVIDSHTFAVAALRLPDIKEQINRIMATMNPSLQAEEQVKMSILESVLWSECLTSCPDCLQIYNRFASYPAPFGLLVLALTNQSQESISLSDSGWYQDAIQILSKQGIIVLRSAESDLGHIRKQIQELCVQPLEFGFELYYPYLSSVSYDNGSYLFTLKVREIVRG